MTNLQMTQDEFLELHEIVRFGTDPLDEKVRFEHISNKQTSSGRWTSFHKVIFRETETGRYYSYVYESGLTEYQEAEDPSMLSIVEVIPQEVTKTIYVPVPKEKKPKTDESSDADPWALS